MVVPTSSHVASSDIAQLSRPISFWRLLIAFTVIQIAFGGGIAALVGQLDKASEATNVVGWQRTQIARVEALVRATRNDKPPMRAQAVVPASPASSSTILTDSLRPIEVARAPPSVLESSAVGDIKRIAEAFEGVMRALRQGGAAVSPGGYLTVIAPLSCADCADAIRRAEDAFSLFSALSLEALKAPAPQLIDSLRAAENRVVDELNRINTLVEQDVRKSIWMATGVIAAAGVANVSLFWFSLGWVRRRRSHILRTAKKFSLLALHTDTMVLYIGHDLRIMWVNPAFEHHSGYDLNDVVGVGFGHIMGLAREASGDNEHELTDAKDSPPRVAEPSAEAEERWAALTTQLFKRGRVEQRELPQRRKDGSPYWVNVTFNAVPDETGATEMYVVVMTDVTAQVQADAQRRDQDSLNSALVESAHNAIVVIDDNGIIESFNPAAERIFQRPRESAVGQSLDLLLPPMERHGVHAARVRAFAQTAQRSMEMGQREVSGVRADGTLVPLAASIAKVSMNGKDRFVAILMDMSSRLEAEAARQEREVAVLASRAKTRFLATISHELRTPLGTVVGYAQLLGRRLDSFEDASLKRYVRSIDRAAQHLNDLIRDVLDLAKIEVGTFALVREPVDLLEVVVECIDHFYLDAEAASIRIDLDRDRPLRTPVVLADRTRLIQVLDNLLSNATKYNRAGGIVRLHVREEVSLGCFAVDVSDTGPGLTEAQLASVFEPFNRLGAETSGVAGTGVGLALCQQLVAGMNGTITVKSKPGDGATFTVSLPAADKQGQTLIAPNAHPATASGRGDPAHARANDTDSADQPAKGHLAKVLLVDDTPENVALFQEILRALPYVRVTVAESVLEAIRACQSETFDLLLLDITLPDGDGVALMQTLKETTQPRARTYAISALSDEEDVQRFIKAGFDGYIPKPLDIDLFLGVVETQLAARRHN